MKSARRLAAELAGAAAVAALVGFLLTQSRVYERVRPFPEPLPGVEWKDIVAFGLPFVVLVWVFVVRRGETTSLLGVLTAAVVVVGHAWSNLDWTVFVSRGTDLARGGQPAPALAVALVLPFAGLAVYHALRRRSQLRRAYAAKGAEPEDVDAVRRVALRQALVLAGGTLALALAVLGGVLAAGRLTASFTSTDALAVGLAGIALALLGLGLPVAARLLGRRARA